MSLPIPNLDDRNFEDLMKEARSLIPAYDREWTNYNPSDPGITLLELFSWLSEMTIYRVNKVPEENYRRFLELLGIEYLFRWNEVPGNDINDFIDFLVETYGVNWVKIARIEKIDGGRTTKIHVENNSILLQLNDKEDKVTIRFDNGSTHDLNVKKELRIYENLGSGTVDGWLFRWDNIPGSDKDKFIDFLTQKDKETVWLKNAGIEKIDEGKTIRFFDENQYILIKLNDEENKVTLYKGITSGIPEKKYDFDVIKDLKVYETIESDIRRGLESISKRYRAITSDDFEFLANECIETLQKDLSGRAICVNNRDLEYGKTSSSNSQPGHVSVIIIPGIEKPEFSWDEIPGNDNTRLLEFLVQIYGVEYLFSWDNIPGNDNGRLIHILMQNYSIDWLKTAKIEKIDNGNTIKVSVQAHFLTLSLNNEKIKVSLKIDNGRTDEFIAKNENGKLNIYGADWIKSAKIEKSQDLGTVTISEVTGILSTADNPKSISLKLNANKVTMESRLYSPYEFTLIKEEKLNVYCYTRDGKPSELLKDQVMKYLTKRKLVTTRLHVVAPDYRKVTLSAYISLKENTLKDTVIEKAKESIIKYFDPLEGGKESKGWHVGRNLYRSEIYQLLEGVPGVDHVVRIKIDGSDAESVVLKEYQLIGLDKTTVNIEVYNE